MPPVPFKYDTPTEETLVPTVAERCVFIRVDGLPRGGQYEAHLLMGRMSGARFITIDSDMTLPVADLADGEIVPVV